MKLPKYQRIYKDLQRKIEMGAFENGDKFYTEQELINMYDVSSITAIRALNELAKNGYIVRKQGKGSFISRSRKHRRIVFSDIEKFEVGSDSVTVLSMTKGNEPDILKKLNLSSHDFYFCIIRTREANGVKYLYHKTYIPERYIKPEVDKSYYASIYERFKEDFDIHMTNEISTETNEILFPAPHDVIDGLELTSQEPVVLQIRTTQSSLSRHVFEYIETYKKWDYYKIELLSNPTLY
ncbi:MULTISPECIES: GntR family transcriptional regulator [unclassified Granulicatella]|uniref:GntR family transcriptional regulator n=1 Tax=unclassified Granulicatella TaxID=2630493 RepID=UPI0010738692|nr:MULTISPECIES: GntR family transcriptional regulator [unclassified Granulicatella]MBF0779958.1 GntR family transcriptional regulator [Granulicatella sp. 19428wC4_WM01]TFU95974.1 GntR family transcriptional regulator [Granulicatella sp. WM01]